MQVEWIDAVLDNGKLIRIEVPSEYLDQAWEAINNCLERGEVWSPLMFDGCSAEYLGLNLDRVNMQKVIGFL